LLVGLLFRLIGQYVGHQKAMRLQVQVKNLGRQLGKVRCQTQTFKLALSVVFGIGHAHLLEGVSDRTPPRVLSVVHTTEQDLTIRDDAGEGDCGSKRPGELFCSDLPRQGCDDVPKGPADI
jgi:hypothetical protein